MSQHASGIVRGLLAAVLWSSSSLLIDRLSTIYHLTPLQISTWRVTIVVPIVASAIAVRRPGAFRPRSRDLPFFLAAGFVGIAVSNVSWAASVQINKPAAAAALGFSAPAFVAIGDRFFLGTTLRLFQIGAVGVNLLGCALVSGIHTPGDLVHAPGGLAIGLTNGLAFASYSLLGRTQSGQHGNDPMTNLLYLFGFGALALLMWGLVVDGVRLFELPLDATGWSLLVVLAVGPTLGAYALYNSALRFLSATHASLVTTLEPPLVAVSAYFLLGRAVQLPQWFGIAFIVGAVLALHLRWPRPSSATGERTIRDEQTLRDERT